MDKKFLSTKVGSKKKPFSKKRTYNFKSDLEFSSFALNRLANFMNEHARQLSVTKKEVEDAKHRFNSRRI